MYTLVSLSVFITGAVIMVIELLGTRILAPFYGTTLYVWASMISTALIFLSVGYFIGGALADKKPQFETFYTILIVTGLSLLLIPILSSRVLILTNPLGTRLGALASSILLFSLQFTLLGTVAPFAIRLSTKKVKTTGITAGGLYGIATIGSFFGTLLTGFFLIPNFGIRTIMYASAIPLFIFPIFWFILKKRYGFSLLIPLIILMYGIGSNSSFILAADTDILFKAESLYGQVKVVDKDGLRYLLVNGAIQTCLEENRPCTRYIYTMALAPLLFDEIPDNALVMGLGGGVLPEGLKMAGIETETVEIDPVIVSTAREYFNFTGKVTMEDARTFVRAADKNYDMVFLDAFSVYLPASHLYTVEAFLEIKDVLSEDGVFVVNTLGWVEGEGSIMQKSVYATLENVFNHVYVVPLNRGGFSNVIFFASDRELEVNSYELGEGGMVITDNHNPLEFMAISGAEIGRGNILNFFGEEVLLS